MGLETATLLIAATVASVGGTLYSARQQSKAADINAKVEESNAAAARQKAKYDEDLHRERVRKLISSQRALYGKSGVDTTGSPLLVLEDTAAQGELDALAIRFGGDVSAAQSRNQASAYRRQGKSARTSGYLRAGQSLLTGANRVRESNHAKNPKLSAAAIDSGTIR